MSDDNVLINGRTAVHAGSNGVLTTVDVCNTVVGLSIVPLPYINIARSADADRTASDVLINGHPACHIKSVFASSIGDEPGNQNGIRSGTIQGEARFVSGSFDVLIEGQPAVRAGDLMTSNNGNTPPAPLMQPIGLPPFPEQAEAPETLVAPEPDVIAIDQYREHSTSTGMFNMDKPED